MKCGSFRVYIAGRWIKERYELIKGISFDVRFDYLKLGQKGYDWIWILTKNIGILDAYEIFHDLSSVLLQDWHKDYHRDFKIKRIQRWLAKKKKVNCLPESVPRKIIKPSKSDFSCDFYHELIYLLKGRNLFFTEIKEGLKELGVLNCTGENLKFNLIKGLIKGELEILPANNPELPLCLRCGNKVLKESKCGICGNRTWFCPECREMGESLTCRPIFRSKENSITVNNAKEDIEPIYKFPLTSYQKEISHLLVGILTSKNWKWLVWAVCGAGKTEVTFEVMAKVLKSGGRVLFTSPRREVVRQMVERLSQAFSGVKIIGLYGGSINKYLPGQLIVATVHQLVRFYQAFDLVIFDEIDAYPYRGDLRLVNLLQRSMKPGGRMVLLSATPGNDLLKEARKGKLTILTLPVRFHKKIVPLPRLVKLTLPSMPQYKLMPEQIKKWIEESVLKDLAQLYIFMPTKKLVEIFGQTLKMGFKDQVYFTHSGDIERSTKVRSFLQGEYPILVTTTLLERGVTVPKANVMILYADSPIFTYQSLIQMAGRGGRSLKAPDAKIWFVGSGISLDMKKAVRWINNMNRLAKRKGLIDETD